ncbi:FeoA family protein [Clostridium estertheticum]|uniref:Ferrous iron transport protein A n=1 Tax=Clostridium estertheticum TaxID=238834 RepID=A0A7Y3STJ7_9CLOT|nr:ferrous iron transport protein A [Clostridium estertheticum]MBW9170148.1 ferrous iron transport protein A [Clostridium estertheticum]MBX4263650.1 ferrous iron transport protein A [Clostridium estertheticum]NNU74882.1 ferrous iron transport protein A [Clostridium estertheticum]WBL47341.1 ferrous iron transport protein A [Clostridium estertheticum]WLC75505.1 ferrous iron transport protein A [Clostridium estertheticum]
MEKIIGLDKVDLKSRVKVVQIVPGSTIRRRIMDMGITIGVQLVVEGKAPMGDPIEIQVRGYKLSLRKNEAKDIMVELI